MIVSAAWVVPAILGAATEIVRHAGSGGATFAAVFAGASDWLIYALLTPLVFMFSAALPMRRPHLWWRFSAHMIGALVFCALWAAAGSMLEVALRPSTSRGDVESHLVSWLLAAAPFGVAVYLGLVASEQGLRHFLEGRERELQLAHLGEQLSQARLDALQATVNPHFLFNTLNTINVLVRDGDRRAASSVIDNLAALLRRMLSRGAAQEITLAEELELVRHYLAIEQVRFSDRLRVEFQIDEDIEAVAVPSFSVQHLVENAIRHGIARHSDAGSILVSARREGDAIAVTVLDDGAGIQAGAEIARHGLDNTRQRLRALHGEGAELRLTMNSPRGARATMRLPWRRIDAGVGT